METQQTLNAGQIYDLYFPLDYGSALADFGCGTMAFFSFEAAKRVGNKGVVYAIDVQKSVVETVKDRAKVEGAYNLISVWSDLEKPGATKLDKPEVDYIVLSTTLVQCHHHQEVMREAWRLLKKNGQLLFIEWSPSAGIIGPAKEYRLQPEYAERLAQETGFIKVKNFLPSSLHYGFIFRKP